MKIFSESRSSYFSIEVAGVETMFPSLHLSVEVSDEGFAGLNGEVWVDNENLKKFVADLQNCERTRNGAARLVSLIPDDLELSVEKLDGWGHFVLRYKISKVSRSPIGLLATSVGGAFNLDSGLLGQIVSEFADLLPA